MYKRYSVIKTLKTENLVIDFYWGGFSVEHCQVGLEKLTTKFLCCLKVILENDFYKLKINDSEANWTLFT